jgi:hypothetical protein
MICKIKILGLFLLIISACNNNRSQTITEPKKEVFRSNKFVGEWVSLEKEIPYEATLVIKQDFEYGACLSSGFSKGYWQEKGDLLILNSSKTNTCYYLSAFGINCFLISETNDIEELKTTLKDCIPENRTDYVMFTVEEFELNNDTLIHISIKDTLCPEMTDKFTRKKK